LLGRLDRRAGGPQPILGLTPAATNVIGELQVTGRGRVGELDPDRQLVTRGVVQRVAGRVRTPMLHRLQHARQIAADPMRPVSVLINNSRDSTHTQFSLTGPWLRQYLEVLVALPVGDRGEVALPLIALVVREHLVQTA